MSCASFWPRKNKDATSRVVFILKYHNSFLSMKQTTLKCFHRPFHLKYICVQYAEFSSVQFLNSSNTIFLNSQDRMLRASNSVPRTLVGLLLLVNICVHEGKMHSCQYLQ